MPTDLIQQFIREHLDADPQRLLLTAHRYPGVPMPYVASQLLALRKVRDKIPAWYDPALHFPPQLSIEQSSSERTARFKASLFSGARLADLTGGLGVDTWAWAAHFEEVTYVEQNPELVKSARHNFQVLAAHNIRCVAAHAENFLTTASDSFDLLYLDPARRDEQQRKVFRFEDCQPDVVALREILLAHAPRVLVKTAPLLDLKLAAKQLLTVSHIWVVSVHNECKEVLYLIERNAPPAAGIPVTAVALGEMEQVFTFTWPEEQQAVAPISAPQQYLYEPDAAVLKAGAFRSFAQRFGLSKLHTNTHLYTSNQLRTDVPGRRFQIMQVCKYDRKSVQAAVPEGRANLATRNFPDTVEAVRRKLALADGGDLYLFAATTLDHKKEVLVCRKA